MENIKSSLVCIAKNEENYLDEWIRYHLKLGISEIFVFQNNWRYPFGPYEDERVHLIEFDGVRMMNPCYNHFINKYHDKFDFSVFLDVDEFLVINTNESIDDVFSSYVDEECVYVNWRIFGDSGHSWVTSPDYSCIKRFTMCDDRLHRLGKNILNFRKYRDRYSFYNPHIVLIDGKPPLCSDSSQTSKFQRIWESYPQSEQRLELFHFKNKTFPELLNRKFYKDDAIYPGGNPVYQNMTSFKKDFDEFNTNKVKNTKLMDFMYT